MNLHPDLDNQLFVVDAIAKTHSVMQQFEGKNIRVAYSGGSDSDTVLWFLRWLGYEVPAVFYNTGLEYQATWNHLDYMVSQRFQIDVIKAVRPIPTSQHKYGNAFINKYVSEMLERLQHHNFDFKNHGNLSWEELNILYPNCQSALHWWTNTNQSKRLGISWNKNLKEFLILYGLPFKVSGKCCDGAKKLPVKKYAKENSVDLFLLGIRQQEKGTRSAQYRSCYLSAKKYSYSMYFPLFWWKQDEKKLFDNLMNIQHSKAYTEYGLKRTGCAGCPFGRNFEFELDVIQEHEPKLYKGINTIFGSAYEWTRKYREFAHL